MRCRQEIQPCVLPTRQLNAQFMSLTSTMNETGVTGLHATAFMINLSLHAT